MTTGAEEAARLGILRSDKAKRHCVVGPSCRAPNDLVCAPPSTDADRLLTTPIGGYSLARCV
jgi:hypothetical protein